ncbi:hypothetical protein ABKN59_011454 [Abortiporus biennis]
MDNPQYYQPLSAALHAPLVTQSQPPHPQSASHYSYGSHASTSAPSGPANNHREEEEEEEEDDEEVVEEELDHQDNHQSSSQSSPRASASQQQPGSTTTAPSYSNQPQDQGDDSGEKRKPGRPRGSRNRKPRAPPGTANKVPANSQHPGFYQYPPAPGAGGVPQNQQFYEFQWRALNLCHEFYNAAEELIKAANPMVIAQCYQLGPGAKIDPMALISEAKRVCDSLLANPSQLVGSAPPTLYSHIPTYSTMPPPPPPSSSSSASAPPAAVITNPQSFVMSLGAPSISAPVPTAPYYPPPLYATPGSRYPTTPYYSYQPGSYYPQQPPAPHPPTPATPPPTPAPAPTPTNTTTTTSKPTSSATATATISTFNAATGTITAGGQQGTWSEDEVNRLKRLVEQSKEMGGAQGKGEIEWDWVVHQWGNTRTRHQILLKATSMGLKESTTRGTKRRRENEPAPDSHSLSQNPSNSTANHNPSANNSVQPPPPSATTVPPNASPALSHPRPPSTSTPVMANSTIPSRVPSTSTTSNQPPLPTTASSMPWPMPTVAANTPSPVIPSTNVNNPAYYRARQTGTTPYGAAPSPTMSQASVQRPPSSGGTATHQYMYRPNGAAAGRRENGA